MEMAKYTAIACKVIEGEKVAEAAFNAEKERHDAECKKVAEDFKAVVTEAVGDMSEEEFVEWLNEAQKDDSITPKLYRMVMYAYGMINTKFGRKVRQQEQFDAIMAVVSGLVRTSMEDDDE